MVLKYKYQGLHRGFCNSLDILRQGIKILPGVSKNICVVTDVQVLTKQNN